MSDQQDEFNTTFVIDTSDPKFILSGLAATARHLPDEWLHNWLRDFIAMEQYEEAGVIKKEMEARK